MACLRLTWLHKGSQCPGFLPPSYPVCSRRAASRLCFDSSPGLMLPPRHSFLISTPNCFCLSSFLLLSHESMNYPFALLCSQGLLEGMETLLMYSQPMSSLPAIILSAPPNITGPALAQPPANQPQSWVPFAVRTLLLPAPYQGHTLGWCAPGSLIRTLSSLPPLPDFRQQHLGNTGALITDDTHPLFRN